MRMERVLRKSKELKEEEIQKGLQSCCKICGSGELPLFEVYFKGKKRWQCNECVKKYLL